MKASSVPILSTTTSTATPGAIGSTTPQLGPATSQHELGDQRLLEAVVPLCLRDLRPGVGRVDPGQRGARVDQVVVAADRLGQQLR